MTAPASAPAAVGRLRFRGRNDPPAAAARLARALGDADWSVPGLPPAAVLCVRRLRARPTQPGAVDTALADAARGTARPARGFVPAAAGAVWFADEAERLACLARDAAAGEERRLADALGIPAAPGWLIRRTAAVLTGPASVDIMLSLDDLPVEIRLAGLDRDPGWVPAAGATIRFHYQPRG